MAAVTEPRNTIRSWALAAVALTSLALIGFTAWLIWLLGVSDWCARAVGATKAADARPEYAVGACFGLLNKQVEALSINSFIALGTLALCLAVLVVIVLAGGKLSFKASATEGVDVNMSGDPQAAAQFVADKTKLATQAAADQVQPDKPEGEG
jgi:hypothetical protein